MYPKTVEREGERPPPFSKEAQELIALLENTALLEELSTQKDASFEK